MPLITQSEIMRKTADKIVSDQNTDLSVSGPVSPDISETPEQPSVLDTIGAAFNQENLVGSFINRRSSGDVMFDSFRDISDTFDPLDHIEGYELQAKDFIHLQDEEEVEQRKVFIDKQIDDRRTIALSSNWVSFPAMAAAGIVDPTILIPGGAAIKAGRLGARILQSAGKVSALSTAAIGVQELGLQAIQTERTIEETGFNILAGAVLGGAIGGAIPLVSSSARAFFKKDLVNIQKGVEPKLEIKQDGSVGAAKVEGIEAATAKEEGIANLNETFVKAMGTLGRSPTVRGLTSPNLTTRQFTNGLFNHNFILNKNIAGEASEVSMESVIKLDRARATNLISEVQDIYVKSKADTSLEKLTLTQFNDKVGKAMRRGDVSDNPFVQTAAQKLRKEWNVALKRMQALELIAKDIDVKTATSYFSRVYNHRAIQANSEEFLRITRDYFRRTVKGIDEAEVITRARSVKNNILGEGGKTSDGLGAINLNKSGAKPSFTKGRVFLIPDEEIEQFLVSDAAKITENYLGQSSDAIRFTEMMDNLGFKNLSDIKKSIDSDTQTLNKGATPEQVKKNNKAATNDKRLVEDSLGLFFGRQEQDFGATLRTLRKFQVITKLGSVTLSSIPDLAMPIFKHGLGRTIIDGYSTIFRGFKTSKIAKDELKDFGVGLELQHNDILRSMTDPDFRNGLQAGRVEQFADNASNLFSRLSGMAYWNNFGKRVAGQMSVARTMRAIEAESLGKITPKEATRLRSLGLSVEDAATAFEEFKKYGTKESGSYIANFKSWDDARVKEIFGTGVLKDVDSTIITPGRGDIPISVQSNEFTKTIFQFKSFMFAASNKILLSGLQRRDADALLGIIGMMGMAILSLKIKDELKGQAKDYTTTELLRESVDRSGVIGMLALPMFVLNPFTTTSRYAQMGTAGLIMGPTGGAAVDVSSVLPKIFGQEDMTNADKRKMLRLVPYSNLFYLQQALQKGLGISKKDD